ncbi:MAG TPA: CBS domain-containing protein [Rhizomicrobium sp.]|nr:CBS domain-containing protein [Rhizomicrobium sp.]
MTCSALMTKDPLTARESETVGAASEKLIAHHYINLPVVDGAGKFLGMFGIYDLLSLLVPRVALAGGLLPNLRFISDDPRDLRTRYREIRSRLIGEVADREAVVVHPDTPEIEALRLFCRHHTTLAVVERGSRKLVGIMSYWDAIRALTQEP